MGVLEEVLEKLERLEEKVDNLPAASGVGELEPADLKGKFADKEGLSAKEVAEYLSVSESWVRRHKEELPHTKLGNRVIFLKSAIKEQLTEDALENQRREPDKREVEGAIIRKLSS